jgi:hypothetical protein
MLSAFLIGHHSVSITLEGPGPSPVRGLTVYLKKKHDYCGSKN